MDAVDDLGMDPAGGEPIESALSAAYETGTLIVFPPGDYRVEKEGVIHGDKDRFGMAGLGDDPKNVTFHFPKAAEGGTGYWFLRNQGGSEVLFKNFSIELTDDHDTAVSIMNEGDDELWCVDLEWLGFIPRQASSPGQLLRMQAKTLYGVATARRITIGKYGSAQGGHSSSTGTSPGYTFIRNEPDHIGEFRLEDSHLEQCGHNTMRSSNNDGVVTVKNCFIKNADISGLRFNGGDHPEKTSLIENCHFLVDHRELNDTGGTAPHHAMGGVFADSRVGNAGLVVRNCDFEWKHILQETIDNDGSLWGIIRVPESNQSNPGGITIEDCRIFNDTICPNIWINGVSTNKDNQLPDRPWEVDIDNVHCTTYKNRSQQGDWIFYIGVRRSNSNITNSCIYALEGEMDGMLVEGCDDVLVEDCNIAVSGEKVIFENSTGSVNGITSNETCTLPGKEGE
ncbi:hypothetical protein RH858_16090 [Halalkaliarchaeum sp. AArc-GB]|uniref:hypothetical protein n=1 Tax=Halalkaliarchaeum sp. AArc-GB TaxID=3074078 RepID=UPI002859FF02|nr:hypothetical protein [Halalkaliarchaeum sp. AArc-GB]MDR5674646.1 hypothetical protein [Halalkaliarchaeum sp. AArc-GB]